MATLGMLPLHPLPNAKTEADVASAEVVPGVGLVYRMLLLLQVREHAGVLSKAEAEYLMFVCMLLAQ
ncbi:hypothetical protein PR003_g17639 [Phytophthora rubi]|uniref:Uncharacterized protein n=1 Tax=Phytophthora rubi TaxID=129364 RepID=A0A6A4EAL8_9STRA|nr:hypothetical protein PR003_g17639 [Phytophthora rubi]